MAYFNLAQCDAGGWTKRWTARLIEHNRSRWALVDPDRRGTRAVTVTIKGRIDSMPMSRDEIYAKVQGSWWTRWAWTPRKSHPRPRSARTSALKASTFWISSSAWKRHSPPIRPSRSRFRAASCFPDDLPTLMNDERYVKDGKITPEGIAELKKRMPFSDFTEFDKNPSMETAAIAVDRRHDREVHAIEIRSLVEPNCMRWIWIDKFVEFTPGTSATAMKNVSLAEEHLHDLYPAFPIMPHSLIIEGMAQTAGILVGEARNFSEKVILAKIGRATFHRLVRPAIRSIISRRSSSSTRRAHRSAGRAGGPGCRIAAGRRDRDDVQPHRQEPGGHGVSRSIISFSPSSSRNLLKTYRSGAEHSVIEVVCGEWSSPASAIISPIGIGSEAHWESLLAGKVGVRRIAVVRSGGFPCQIAGRSAAVQNRRFRSQDLSQGDQGDGPRHRAGGRRRRRCVQGCGPAIAGVHRKTQFRRHPLRLQHRRGPDQRRTQRADRRHDHRPVRIRTQSPRSAPMGHATA